MVTMSVEPGAESAVTSFEAVIVSVHEASRSVPPQSPRQALKASPPKPPEGVAESVTCVPSWKDALHFRGNRYRRASS